MPAYRIVGVEASTGSLAKLRVTGVELSGTISAQPKYRVRGVDVSGTLRTTTNLRVRGVQVNGTIMVNVVPPASITVGPKQQVELMAGLTGGGNADSWNWFVVSGHNVTMTGSGASRVITAPDVWNQANQQPVGGAPAISTAVIGINATVNGVTSPTATMTITILPQLSWVLQGTTWAGAHSAPA